MEAALNPHAPPYVPASLAQYSPAPAWIIYHPSPPLAPPQSPYYPPLYFFVPPSPVGHSDGGQIAGGYDLTAADLRGKSEEVVGRVADEEGNKSEAKVMIKKGRKWIQQRKNRRMKLRGDSSECFVFNKDDDNDGRKTTLMIKNLPNRFTMNKVVRLLDDHCWEVNHQLEENSDDMVFSEFDFLYLPVDFKTGFNMGYAFVNFTSAIAARRLYDALHNFQWKTHGSRKVCEVTYARIQGITALRNHFNNSIFVCGNDEYLPVYYEPPRDGYRQPEPRVIGRRLVS